MAVLDTRFLERQQFFDGQRLLAEDLQTLEAFHREMRQLHNRSLHQPGIGNGFAVTGRKGDRELRIGPGYALDADGQEIVLTAEVVEPIPPVAGGDDGLPAVYQLTVAYPSDADLEEVETRRGLCGTAGTVRLREAPVFCWVRLVRDPAGLLIAADARLGADVREGRKIVLAQVEVAQCQLVRLSIAQRRNARPATQPRIACGRAAPRWTMEAVGGDPIAYQLVAPIDGGTAGFFTPPCWSARIDGPRLLSLPVEPGEEFPPAPVIFDGVVSIHEPTTDGFTLRVLLFAALYQVLHEIYGEEAGREQRVDAVFGPWRVEWLGVER